MKGVLKLCTILAPSYKGDKSTINQQITAL